LSSHSSSIKDLAELLQENARFLCHYPSCSYLVRLTLRTLEKESESINDDIIALVIKDFVEFMYSAWDSGTSAVSATLDIPLQIEFIREHIALYMQQMAEILKMENWKEYRVREEAWLNDFKKIAGIAQTKWKEYKPSKRDTAKKLRLLDQLKPWEREFLTLISKYALLREQKEPVFLLKSGYRSFYFFNASHLVSKGVNAQENLEIMQRFKNALKSFTDEIRASLRHTGRPIVFLLIQKAYGEDPGTSVLAGTFTELGIPTAFLNPHMPSPSFDWPKGAILEGNPLLVPFEDVVTTGEGMEKIVQRYRQMTGEDPPIFPVIFDRSPFQNPGLEQVDGIKVTSMVNMEKLVKAQIHDPEILRLSVASPWWSSLTELFRHDYLKEIYLFGERDNPGYNRISQKLGELIKDSYEIEGNKPAYLFHSFNTDRPLSDITRYLINVHILYWNAIFDISFGGRISRLEDPVEYIETMLRIEETQRPTTIICPAMLKRGLEGIAFPKLIDPWDKIHRIFVLKSADIIDFLKDKYKECEILNMSERESITLGEAYSIIDETLESRREIYKRFNRDIRSTVEEEPKLRELMLRHLKQFYEIGEKPPE